MIPKLARIVTHRWWPWALGLLALALTLSALPAALNKPFVFMDGGAAHSAALMASGVLPWWALPGGQVAFWRPLAALTHWLDFALWPANPALMHLQSLLWLGLLVAAAASLYRRLSAGAAAASLAGLLYAIDHTHGFAASWISNRNILIAALFGALALAAHVRWRRDGWRPGALLSLLLLLAALLSAEAAVAILAYWLAYAVFLDRGAWLRRLAALAPGRL